LTDCAHKQVCRFNLFVIKIKILVDRKYMYVGIYTGIKGSQQMLQKVENIILK
jgi:hypothetical protein